MILGTIIYCLLIAYGTYWFIKKMNVPLTEEAKLNKKTKPGKDFSLRKILKFRRK
jgi:multidrug resistance efflux pump